MPRGIYHRTKNHNKHIAESLKGRKLSERHKKAISKGNEGKHKYWLGKSLSIKHKNKISQALKGKYCGKNSPLFNKHLSMRTEFKKGHKMSKEIRKKISDWGLSHKEKLSFWKGKHFSEKTKRKMSKNQKGRKVSEKTKGKIRKAHIMAMVSGKYKNKETLIEQKIERELQRRNIYYQSQAPLCNVTVADFYLPETRTVIYCDGDYWHSKKEIKNRDIIQDTILTFNGFNVYRFTETEINKSAQRCINKILNYRKFESEK